MLVLWKMHCPTGGKMEGTFWISLAVTLKEI